MKISYTWLKEYVPKLPTPQKLAKLLTFHVVEIESIGAVNFSTRSKNKDHILNADVLPNRAHDLNSHIGIAREVAILTNSRFKNQESRIKEDKKKKTDDVLSVKIEDAQGCPRYIGRYIEGVKIGPSPKWMQERLEAVGMRSINNVVDATNYVMLEYGQPLHAFDAEQIAGSEIKDSRFKNERRGIIVRKAKKEEKFTTLDDQTFVLDGSELLIADSEKALALAGIKGGKKAGITPKTKNLILEAANFDPVLIRRTSTKLNLRTDSSKKFQGGLHPVLTEKAMARLTSLIQELARGTVYKDAVDVYPKKWPQVRVLFDPVECNALLGTNLKESEMKKTLIALGCQWLNVNRKSLIVIPPERLDLTEPAELYEEIGRIYGWEHIPPKAPHAAVYATTEAPIYRLGRLVRSMLAGLGYAEHVGHALMSERVGKLFKKASFQLVELENPLSEDAVYFRPALTPSLLDAIAVNAKYRDMVRLFEIGKYFFLHNGTLIERWGLGIALYTKKEIKKHETWYELKGIADTFYAGLGLADVTYAEMSSERKEALRTLLEAEGLAEMRLSDTAVGSFGTISRQLKDAYGIEGAVTRVHIDLELLLAIENQEREFAEIPKFPAVMRDVSMLVPRGTKVEAVQNIIERVGGELLFDVDLFDIYEGSGVGENQESLAFHLIFQSRKRTLTDAEVNRIFEKIVGALKEKEWEVRD